jgi:small subunit ribosomal protein S5
MSESKNKEEQEFEKEVEAATEDLHEEAIVEQVADSTVLADGVARKPSAKADTRKPRKDNSKDASPKQDASSEDADKSAGKRRGKGGQQGRRKGRNEQAEQSDFIEKVVQVRRVTKVVKGGKKLSFRTTVIIGNEKGKVGVGVGKAAEVLIAIKKAISDARKNLVDIETVANTNTISHSVCGEAGGSKVLLKPAAEGTGIIAGGTARIVLELAGVGDVLSKSQGSKSPLNVARATVNALQSLRNFQEVAGARGISIKKMLFA